MYRNTLINGELWGPNLINIIYSSFTNIICSSSQPVHVKFILNFSNYTILFSLGVTFLSFISPNPNIGPKGMSVPLTYRAHSLKGQGDSLQA